MGVVHKQAARHHHHWYRTVTKYARTRKYLYKRARQMILYMRMSLISSTTSTYKHNCLPAGSQFILLKTKALPSIWFLHMEAVAEAQQ